MRLVLKEFLRRRRGPGRIAGSVSAAVLALAAAGLFSGEGTVLTGSLDVEKILAAAPGWAKAVQAYQPDSEAVNAIARLGKSVRIRAFVGTWDPAGGGTVAAFIKTLETAGNTAIIVEWVGVSRDLKEPAEPLRAYSVDDVPTFIVWADGEEKGRIVGASREKVEADLAALLVGLPVSGADLNYFRHTPHSHLPIDCTPCHRPGRT